ncbi:f4130eba-9efe-4896-a050-402be9594186 [Thermothielavioides terrestris]|uniref:F4130eba-9efe-4896-a050-402be9594186 n=1 Tax=Thermothielavioides terrestris TaxID=2587410 RepID=A0A3S4BHP8_9PEZI|nr:f4130eba-9efe-4896-a050-402be9594186 [Thermothielavioides terrestris]
MANNTALGGVLAELVSDDTYFGVEDAKERAYLRSCPSFF